MSTILACWRFIFSQTAVKYNYYSVKGITMNNLEMNGYQLYDFIEAGAKKVIANQKYLNRINVFPIADGDTGSNLAFTMNNIIRNSTRDKSVSKTLDSIAKYALEASYGNSGTIVASYFNGLARETEHKEKITVNEFAKYLSKSVSYAYNSITMPKEGTILTVMREWGEYLIKNVNNHADLSSLFYSSIKYLGNIVEKTKTQLEELRQANVVDAGAKAFVYFVEGIYEFITTGKVNENADRYDIPVEMLDIHQDIIYRYCSEYDLLIEDLGKIKEIESKLISYGDSIIINERRSFVKFHIHTDNPEKVALFLREYGKIIGSKVDDMLIQYEISNNKKYEIGLLTDSIADLREDFIVRNQISVLPLQMIADEEVYLDRVTITTNNIYKVLDNSQEFPKSSQPTDSYIRKTLEYLLQHFEFIIGIFISSKMSGTYSKVKTIANEIAPDRIFVYDSKSNSGSEGLIVRKAALALEQGKSIEEIDRDILNTIEKSKIFVEIPDLSYAVKSGRVPAVVGKIASMFKLNVIISIDDEGNGTVKKDRSIKKVIKKLAKKEVVKEYVIIHSSKKQKVDEIVDYATKLFGFEPLYVNSVSAVITALVGRDSLGIAYEQKLEGS